ncbi:trihelix transcription factor GTL1 isoform X2 [Arabidopsis lyrata subsp. lyrata]|uniref:trihelix transcription factor GTL1 isoform X2 n=1 Tax=Arabidopsis lyrata subsp. lyrata TaxID=81972 RepID=UPI000A29C217|nr:trihelix transcription factor GTL1 isoform X2 [Arabidopsis lyrata subsp. lyrata]|eukprot:XP_020868151.1 trihelix transcription factor GTL1 isoform X2 [Arabidopsis lyrata subsp. lyrata]
MEQGGGGGGGNEVVEEASPISSRPPANNLEELMRFSAAADDGGGGGGGGGGSASSSSGNRWPREETLALLRIRSDMDSTFRDATLKAPLWEHVSRKLLELGYKRSSKKCKEKFENVQKYYKRTKETRGGRHDGKAYKFFSQLEALNTTPPSSSLDVTPLSVANPILMPTSSSSPFPVFSQPQPQPQPLQTHNVSFTPTPPPPPLPSMVPTFPGVTFSSHSSSTASGMGSDDDDDEMDVDQANIAGSSSRKRKRGNRGGGGKMMKLFEGLVRQVMQKQAAMQRSFLEALEKREQERLDREEAWKRQEMARLAREHEVMSQERAASASRDAAIISLIQKITGHTIQLPPSLSSQPPQPPPPPYQPPPAVAKRVAEPPLSTAQSQLQQPIMAIPQQQILPPPPPPPPHLPHQPEQKQQQQQQPQQQEMVMSSEQSSLPSSSRWPKAEILALINLRSGMEPRYQDNVPKGLLWEEISTSMKRMGYNRNAKRCKEKWENINKYYKKVKESNKKRPQDAKTCPYFHRLDLLYRNKVLGSGGGSSTSGLPQDQKQSPVPAMKLPQEGLVNVQQPHGSASSEEEEPIEESPQGTEKKTL